MAAAAVRALLRRRAAAPPSLALLHPLFPGRGSTPRSPLLAAAAAVGLQDVRRPQLSPAPASPLLRYYSSKPPSSKGCEPPPQWQPPTTGNETLLVELMKQLEREDVEFLMTRGLHEDLDKHNSNLVEALKICYKASTLLNEGYWDNKTVVAMFENGSVKLFEALAGREKAMDDLSGALSSNALSKDALRRLQMFHQEFEDYNKITRQALTNAQACVMKVIHEHKKQG